MVKDGSTSIMLAVAIDRKVLHKSLKDQFKQYDNGGREIGSR